MNIAKYQRYMLLCCYSFQCKMKLPENGILCYYSIFLALTNSKNATHKTANTRKESFLLLSISLSIYSIYPKICINTAAEVGVRNACTTYQQQKNAIKIKHAPKQKYENFLNYSYTALWRYVQTGSLLLLLFSSSSSCVCISP